MYASARIKSMKVAVEIFPTSGKKLSRHSCKRTSIFTSLAESRYSIFLSLSLFLLCIILRYTLI